MNLLAQHLSALRSAVTMERDLEVVQKTRSRQDCKDKDISQKDTEYRTDDIMATFRDRVGPSLRSLTVGILCTHMYIVMTSNDLFCLFDRPP